jgi:uncharacterized membrane protein
MTRAKNRGLLPKKDDDNEDNIIQGEVVNPQLVNQRVIEKFAERDRDHVDFERFLRTVNNFTREQASISREHAEQHPDAIENRNNKVFRRQQYAILLLFLGVLLVTLPFAPLAAATVFGVICIIIVCGVLVNARERELDLSGFVKIITTILGSKEK